MSKELWIIYSKQPRAQIRMFVFPSRRLCELQELVLQSHGWKRVTNLEWSDTGDYEYRVSTAEQVSFWLEPGVHVKKTRKEVHVGKQLP